MVRRRQFNYHRKTKILEKNNHQCSYCGESLTVDTLSIDHIIPICQRGTNKLNNLVPSCVFCNSVKSNYSIKNFKKKIFKNIHNHKYFNKYNHLIHNNSITFNYERMGELTI